jgi:SpoVK/Ycf46/Vps4 family AAA+-type ATPase
MENNIKLENFTPWAKNIYDLYTSKICNTFIVCGNIGDYAFRFYNLTDYLRRLFESEQGFNFDAAILYDSDMGGKYLYNKTENVNEEAMTFTEMCDIMANNIDNHNRIAYIIRYPQSTIPNCSFTHMRGDQENNCIKLHRTLTSRAFFRQESIVIIVAESASDVNPMFSSSNIKSMTIDLSLPDFGERKQFIEFSSNLASRRTCGYKSEIDVSEFARLTAGLTKMGIEDLILQSSFKDPITKNVVLKKKEELVHREYSDIIELLDASDLSLDDFAGQEQVKAYFTEVVINAIANDQTSIIPKGILLMGPPGTGKSYFSRCLAGSAGINFVEFKMSKILDKYVGEAEKNLEKAFAVFRALAPVGVFIDELDQSLSRGTNDSNSVNKNIFGMFLAELSKPENRGKIIWLGATNYPDKIDEALKRTGRFDKKIPFFAPNEAERKLIFEKRLSKTNMSIAKDVDYVNLVNSTKGFTQAEIEGVVVKSLELAIRQNDNCIRNTYLTNALKYIAPSYNENIKEMENVALKECNDLEFLSDEYLQIRKSLF